VVVDVLKGGEVVREVVKEDGRWAEEEESVREGWLTEADAKDRVRWVRIA
jgi:hypothetical protein